MSIVATLPPAPQPTAAEAAIELRGLGGTVRIAKMPKRSAAPIGSFKLALTAGAEDLAVVVKKQQAWELARWLDERLGRRPGHGEAEDQAEEQVEEQAEVEQVQEEMAGAQRELLAPLMAKIVQKKEHLRKELHKVAGILAYVCELFDLSPPYLRAGGHKKKPPLPAARAIAGIILRERGLSTTAVGKLLGVTHCAVVSGCREMRKEDYGRVLTIHDQGSIRQATAAEVLALIRRKFGLEDPKEKAGESE